MRFSFWEDFMKANILGTQYRVLFKNYNDDPLFKERGIDGYHDSISREIVVCRKKTSPMWEKETEEYCKTAEKEILRHEVIHAFLSESGLDASSYIYNNGWAKNEEMVDFFALQFPKIVEVFEKLGCLR